MKLQKIFLDLHKNIKFHYSIINAIDTNPSNKKSKSQSTMAVKPITVDIKIS